VVEAPSEQAVHMYLANAERFAQGEDHRQQITILNTSDNPPVFVEVDADGKVVKFAEIPEATVVTDGLKGIE